MGVRFLDSPAEAKPTGRVRFLDEPAQVEVAQPPKTENTLGRKFETRMGNIRKAAGRTYEGKQTKGEYGLQAAGEFAGGVGDILGSFVSGMVPKKLKEDLATRVAGSPGGKAMGWAAKKYGEFEEEHPRASADINAMANIATAVPAGFLGHLGLKTAGKATESAGKSVLKSGLRIKDVTAKAVSGGDAEKGVQKIVDTITKHNLGSPVGGYKGITKKAQKKISEAHDLADRILKDSVKLPDAPKKDIDGVILDLMERAQKGSLEGIPLGDEAKAVEIISNIQKGLELKGYKGAMNALELNNAKKAITEGRKLFKKGAAAVMEDPLAAKVNELVYLRLRDEVEAIVPEVRKYNQTIYELVPIVKATKEATKRTGNLNKVGLREMIALGAGGAGSYAFKEPAAIATVLAGMAANRLLNKGKGASVLLKLGKERKMPDLSLKMSELKRKLGEGASDLLGENPKIGNMLRNQRGSAPILAKGESFRGGHRPVLESGGGSRLNNLEPSFGKDIYSPNAVRYFGTGDNVIDKKTVSMLQQIRNKPELEISIYRAIPKNAKKVSIASGDWVTINKDYAIRHGESALGGDYRIIAKKVKVEDLITNADSFNEQGYYPRKKITGSALSPALPTAAALSGAGVTGAALYNLRKERMKAKLEE